MRIDKVIIIIIVQYESPKCATIILGMKFRYLNWARSLIKLQVACLAHLDRVGEMC